MKPGVISGPAIIGNGLGGFALDVIEVDPPGPGEVRVAIAAAGVCHTDHASLRWRGPLVLGHEGAGHVESVGPDVHGLEPGQAVLLNWAIPCGHCFQCRRGGDALCERTHELDVARLGTSSAHEGATRWRGRAMLRSFHLGTFASHTVVRREAVTPLPSTWRTDPACILGCAVMTGVGAVVNVAAVDDGDTVAVVGCGGVGINAIQGARLAGARLIVAIDRVAARLERARAFGATHAMLAGDDEEAIVAAVRALSDGRGVDHAFEATGVPALAFLPLRLVRHGGQAVQISGAHGPASLELPQLFWNKRYMTPLYGGCVPARDFPRLFDWIERGELELEAQVTHRYPLHALDRAFDDMLAGRSHKGVLRIA